VTEFGKYVINGIITTNRFKGSLGLNRRIVIIWECKYMIISILKQVFHISLKKTVKVKTPD